MNVQNTSVVLDAWAPPSPRRSRGTKVMSTQLTFIRPSEGETRRPVVVVLGDAMNPLC